MRASIVVVLALISQKSLGHTAKSSVNNINNKKQSLKDWMNWWDFETPDWAKSAEDGDEISDYINYYYPGVDFEYPEDEQDNGKHWPKQNTNVKWKPSALSNNNKAVSQNNPTSINNKETDNARWLKSIGVQSTPNAKIKELSGFTSTQPGNLITRFTRQSGGVNLFGTSATVPSPTLEQCMRTCPVTPEYSPVCGTDNITYSNQGRLLCARFCGKDVSTRRNSACPAGNNVGVDGGNNLPPPPPATRPTTLDIIANSNAQSSQIQTCIRNCQTRGENAPVCGSDGRTYDSPSHLLCAQFCGLDVRVQQLTACTNNNLGRGDESTTQSNFKPIPLSTSGSNSGNSLTIDSGTKNNNNAAIGTNNVNSGNNFDFSFNGATESTTVPPHLRACFNSCPISTLQSPVCGSNKIIYKNPSALNCARICGVDVQTKPLSFCQPTLIMTSPEPFTNTPTPTAMTTKTQNTDECIKGCRLSQETNPVCGTNGVTYRNIDYLRCLKMCGTDVEVRSYSSCQEGTTTSTISSIGSESTAQPSSRPNNTVVNSDIDQDVFVDVFGTTQATTTAERCYNDCRLSEETKPVCGTNGVTYKNIDYLQCLKMCGTDVDVKSYSSCQDGGTTSTISSVISESTAQPSSRPNNTVVDFVIDRDTLGDVFGTSQAITTESEIDSSFIRINDK